MPTSYEIISRTHHGDYTQTTAIETEEGSLCDAALRPGHRQAAG